MKIKNPFSFWIFVFFAVVNVLDAATAFFILPGEANPIYLLTGTIWVPIILKVFVVAGLGFYVIRNLYSSNFAYYMFLCLLIIGSFIISVGVYSNVKGIMNPELLVGLEDIPAEVKIEAYHKLIFLFYIIPLAIAFVPFFIYDKSRNKANVDPEHFKRLPWWKRY